MDNVATLRRAIKALGPHTQARRYSPELRARIRAYAMGSGEPVASVATALTMAPQTLQGFLDGAGPELFVQATPPSSDLARSGGDLVVHGPRGVRVEGMSVEDVIALVRGLS